MLMKNFFTKLFSIIFFIDFQNREPPLLVYDLKYKNKVITVYTSICVDINTKNFKGIIFQFVEFNKFLINDYQEIEYINDKFIILE